MNADPSHLEQQQEEEEEVGEQGEEGEQKELQQDGEEVGKPFKLLGLPRDAIVAVLAAAAHDPETVGDRCQQGLQHLSCTCKQLNLLARTRTPHRLCCRGQHNILQQAQMLITSQPPWTGCTSLHLWDMGTVGIQLLPGMLAAAADWPGLVQLHLEIPLPEDEKQLPPLPQQQQQQQGVQQQVAGQQQQGEQQQEVAMVLGDGVMYTAEPSRYNRQDMITAGPVACLRLLPQLRRLELVVNAFGPHTAACLAASAPQLTRLELAARVLPWQYRQQGVTLCHPPSDWSPLSRLTKLKALVLGGSLCVMPLVESEQAGEDTGVAPSSDTSSSSSSSCLPVNLQEVQFNRVGVLPYWLTHLAGCPQLQKLEVYDGLKKYAASHPALVAAAALQHVPGITSLRFTNGGSNRDGRELWTAHPALLPVPAPAAAGGGATAEAAAEAAAPGAGALLPRRWRPQGPLLRLTQLRELQVDPAAPLVLAAAQDWEGLAQLRRLTMLQAVRIESAPPVSLRPLPLKALLGVHFAGPGCAMRQLLAVLPGLTSLDISQWTGGHEVLAEVALRERTQPGALSNLLGASLTALSINYSNHAPAVAAEHFSSAFAGVTAIQRLTLDWPGGSNAAPPLPNLSPFPRLCHLDLSVSGRQDQTQLEDLLLMLRMAGSLECLTLSHMPLVSPRAVLVLQWELPALRRLEMYCRSKLQIALALGAAAAAAAAAGGGGGGDGGEQHLEEQEWALLQQLVLPRLTFRVNDRMIAQGG